ncbi:hypothetical protein N8I77_010093 [Diaporthe amygdali]|uniref:Uncharacterized protein n=1 Tax=Phomopsis amygdali TaxID=1214568 RepID=A0AAD9S7P9_PHOAM|nr:hypothetical protein N8I77_010093 [Diaporthe amygdali]
MTVRTWKGSSKISANDLAHASKIANIFRPIHHDAGPDLFFTMFAAELSRLLRPARGYGFGSGWSQEDNTKFLTHLSSDIDHAVKLPPKDPSKESLVNSRTHVDGFPQLDSMVDILTTIEFEIARKRSEAAKSSSHDTSLTIVSGQKRKAEETQMPADPEVIKRALHEALPKSLLQDLATHGSAIQDKLLMAQKQLDSIDGLDGQARALKTKLAATEKELESLRSLAQKRGTLEATILRLEQAASSFDRLANRAQALETKVLGAESSLDMLQQCCYKMVKSAHDEEEEFKIRLDLRKFYGNSPPPPPLAPFQPTAVAKWNNGSQDWTVRLKRNGMWPGVVCHS